MNKLFKCMLVICMILCNVTFTNIINVNAADEVSNVAYQKNVYTNPSTSNVEKVTDGETRYQYVSQGASNTFIGVRLSKNTADNYFYDENAYIIVDLGASYVIDAIKVYEFEREGGMIRDYLYDISVCNDASFDIANQASANWSQVYHKESNPGQAYSDVQLGEKVIARYVKMHNLKAKQTTGGNLNEFHMSELEVYGVLADDIDAVKSYANNELTSFKADVTLDEISAQNRAEILTAAEEQIQAAASSDAILTILNDTLTSLSSLYIVENVAYLKSVYTNPSNGSASLLTNGDSRYQYVSQGATNSFIGLRLNSLDGDGYHYQDGTYIIVDLGASYVIDTFDIYEFDREAGYVRDYLYDISVCNDASLDIANQANANWSQVYHKESNPGQAYTKVDLASKVVARYIKLDHLKAKQMGSTGLNDFHMAEIEVYGAKTEQLDITKQYAVKELTEYEAHLILSSQEAQTVAQIKETSIQAVQAATTVEEIVQHLNTGLSQVRTTVVFAKYRETQINDIKAYKSAGDLFSDEDKEQQKVALQQAITDITNAEDEASVMQIVKEYKALVDSFELLTIYEIIPTPHEIVYNAKYYPYRTNINVVASGGALDQVTIDYINEIFGSENVTFSQVKDDSKLNLYLTSDDQNDAIETWMRETYGEKVNNTTLAKNEAHVIFADEHGISIIGNDSEGLFRGLTTIKFIKNQITANSKGYRGFIINDWADMAFRGLIEGYGGNPWAWSEKADLLAFGANFKMNKIVYAPKNDPYHLKSWKELYPDASQDPENNIQNVALAASTARKYKVDLVWTAHCFGYQSNAHAGENGIRYTAGDENIPGSDINLLIAKFEQVYAAGVRTFGLILDDCYYGPRTLNSPYPNIYNKNEPLTDEVLAETTAIVNIMAQWCEDKGDCYDMIFCPSGYTLGWMANLTSPYYTQAYPYQELTYYDKHFKDNVQIITTGGGVWSDTDQGLADAFKKNGAKAELGYAEGETIRSPLMWTNYPTVDCNPTLDFGPMHNFKTNLNPDDMYGIMSNPFQWAEMNKTVIPSVSQYTWNVKDYDAVAVYEAQMKYVMDTPELADAMLIFTDHNNYRDFGLGEGSQALRDAISAFKTNITKENAEAVLAEINLIIEACKTLLVEESYTNHGMYEQLKPYANSLKDLATCIADYMNMFDESGNVIKQRDDANKMYNRHKSYPLKDVRHSTHYTETGTHTLLPFANWLNENQNTIMLTADPNVEEELALRAELDSYLDGQIANIRNEYYHDVIATLFAKKDSLKELVKDELPTLDALKAEVEAYLASQQERKPLKNEANVVSNGKEVIAQCLESETDYPVSNIIDGNPSTTCSTVMGDSYDQAYVQIDLAKPYSLKEIWVVCSPANNRWNKYDVYTSVDGEDFTLLENKNTEISETLDGFWFDAKGIEARYVRLVGIANNINNRFHVGEIKVYANGADYSAVDAALAKVPSDLSIYTQASVDALNVAMEGVVRDKTVAQQVEVDAMAEAINAALDALVLKPVRITNVKAEAVNYKTIKLTWDAFAGATSYVVERLSCEEWIQIAETTEPTYIANGVKTGKAYTYRIKADNAEYSDEVSATTTLTGEVELTITPNGTNQFDLSWTSVDGATRYIIYRKDGENAWKKVLTLGKDATSYTSKAMKANTYQYQVKAARYDSVDRVMTNGSNVVEGIVGLETMIPANVKAEANGTIVTLTWDKVVGMSNYEIYRSKDGGAYRQIKRTSATTITSTGLKVGSTYQFKIRAFRLVNGEKVYAPDVETTPITIE